MYILPQFTAFVSQHQLFHPDDFILLAVSGGKDSVLMAQLFKLAGYKFSIAHCNFNLRADEAQRDELFVKMLAEELEVSFHVAHFDTQAFAAAEKISTQMAARQLRYEWFEEVRSENNYQYIALAQHQNDTIETLLLNLVRGTGISGMHGILPKRDALIRPLLFLTRQQIEEAITACEIAFVEDSSNQSAKYARNKIRLHVVPHLREINPKLEETFTQNIHRFAQTEELLMQVVAQTRQNIFKEQGGLQSLSIAAVQQLRPQQLLFFELLKPYHFTAKVANEILDALERQSGTSFYSKTHRLTIDREQLIISEIAKEAQLLFYVHSAGEVKIGYDQFVNFQLVDSLNFHPQKSVAFVDANLLIFPLVLRYRADGDRFKPLGMKSFKKLSDFLIDEKIALPQKDRTPLLVNGNGEIIWVVGLRQDERYKVSPTTKKVAIFELLNQ